MMLFLNTNAYADGAIINKWVDSKTRKHEGKENMKGNGGYQTQLKRQFEPHLPESEAGGYSGQKVPQVFPVCCGLV